MRKYRNEINSTNSALNNTIETDEEEILNEYYEAIEKKNKIESELEVLNNNKIKLTNELDDFEFNIKKENSQMQMLINMHGKILKKKLMMVFKHSTIK